MSQVDDKDVVAIRDWLAKEPSLPTNFEDIVLRKFLFSCNCSLEQTKKCIEEFCVRRTNMPEIFADRDPCSPRMQEAFNMQMIGTYNTGVDEFLLYHLTENTENFDFYNQIKGFMVLADNWMRYSPNEKLAENHIVIIDMKNITMSLIPKLNIFYFQKFLIFLLESMPIRLKHVHAINCPSFYEYLYGLVKSALPKHICDLIHFHTDYTKTLYEFIDKKGLPVEYGGEAESIALQNRKWVEEVVNDKRKFYLDNELWKADLSKMTKKNSADTAMSGSFRTLAID